jgi:hypothetical protein
MSSKSDPITTSDPPIHNAVPITGTGTATTDDDSLPCCDYQTIEVTTRAGTKTIEPGQELYDDTGDYCGIITRVTRHPDNGEINSWHWTVWMDYPHSSIDGGLPLGELTEQLQRGAYLA